MDNYIQQIEYSTNRSNYGENHHNSTCTEQASLKCSECKHFVGYQNLEKLQRLRRQKRLTACLELLEKQGLTGDVAIFILSAVGGVS